ncbi:hypothetical protein [Kosmotoga sp. DU53]|jgi:DNA polymerase (family 10)|uniref:hypothetical protein n=1 Tax=Kosmotoga sp. DU53 TaxID=1310160 RepID=UPI0009EE5334|nr:hypothetical protein [Kosmotoga sp. DU53]MDI3523763.1 polymerase [Kosmotoga sp.]MDK2953398.1 polymerase [Kosmotoga sp.]
MKSESVNKVQLAKQFQMLARLLEVLKENPFKIRAYRFAANVIGSLDRRELNLKDVQELSKIKGIGKAIVEKSKEFLETGKIRKLDEIREMIPDTIRVLAEQTTLSSKTLAVMWKDYGIAKKEEIISFLNDYKRSLKLSDSDLEKVKEVLNNES